MITAQTRIMLGTCCRKSARIYFDVTDSTPVGTTCRQPDTANGMPWPLQHRMKWYHSRLTRNKHRVKQNPSCFFCLLERLPLSPRTPRFSDQRIDRTKPLFNVSNHESANQITLFQIKWTLENKLTEYRTGSRRQPIFGQRNLREFESVSFVWNLSECLGDNFVPINVRHNCFDSAAEFSDKKSSFPSTLFSLP